MNRHNPEELLLSKSPRVISSNLVNRLVHLSTVCPSLLIVTDDLIKLSVKNSKGFNRHMAVNIENGHSELDLQAYSAGLTSPKKNLP